MAEAQDIIRAVVAVLAANGKIDADERDFLERIARELAVPGTARGRLAQM